MNPVLRGNFSWTHTPVGIPSLATVVCAAHSNKVTISTTYGGVRMATAKTNQQSGAYVGMQYLNNPPAGVQTVVVNLSAASGSTDVQCSATTWTGTAGVDTVIGSPSQDMSGGATQLSLYPGGATSAGTVPVTEVFFGAIHRYVPQGSALLVAGSGATASIVDSNTASGYGCQQLSNSWKDCISSAQLLPGGTSLIFSWTNTDAGYAVATGFGVLMLQGYAGNKVFYMTTGLSDTNHPYFLPTTSNASSQTASYGYTATVDAINVSAGQDPSTTDTNWFYDEYYVGGGSKNYMLLNIPIVAGGGSSMLSNGPCKTLYYVGVCWYTLGFQNLSLSTSSPIAGAAYTLINTAQSGGLNVTPTTTPLKSSAERFEYDTACAVPLPTVGVACYLNAVVVDFSNTTSAYQSNTQSFGGAPAYEKFTVSGGTTYTVSCGFLCDQYLADNVFASVTLVTVKVPQSDWTSSMPTINITGQNIIAGWSDGGQLIYTAQGATGSVQIPMEPAVTLTGTIYKTGQADAGQAFSLTSSNGTVYNLMTDANGRYRFFSALKTQYTISAPLPSSWSGTQATNSTTTPNAPTSTGLNLTIPKPSTIEGYVKDTSGNPIYDAQVNIAEPYPPGTTIGPTTNSYGFYSVTAGMLGTYTFNVGANGYYSASGSKDVNAWGTTFWMNFTLTPVPPPSGGGGGGGCVLAGTLIAAPNGQKRVELLSQGDIVLGYNVTSGTWVKESVNSNTASTVSEVLSINNGQLEVTLTEQPLYVQNGTWIGWVRDPQNLSVGEQIYNPSTGSWIPITSLQVLSGTFTVCDLRVTAPNDFVANGILALDKHIY